MEGVNFRPFQEEFPVLFGEGQFISLGVGQGWFYILWDLCVALEALARHRVAVGHPPLRVVQIKEKFGSLCFYIHGGTDTAYALIEAAEAKSETICEACGRPGNTHTIRGWYRTVCPFHEMQVRSSAPGFQEGPGAE